MGWRWIRLEADGHSYVLVSGSWAAHASHLHALEPCRAERLLAEAMRGGDTRSLSRFVVDECELVALEGVNVLERAQHGLRIGRLTLLEEPRLRPSVDVTVPLATDLSDLVDGASDLLSSESESESESGAASESEAASGATSAAESESAPPTETYVAFVLRDQAGNALADRSFTLEVPDGRTVEGTTDGDGRFTLDPVHTAGDCVLRFTDTQSAA